MLLDQILERPESTTMLGKELHRLVNAVSYKEKQQIKRLLKKHVDKDEDVGMAFWLIYFSAKEWEGEGGMEFMTEWSRLQRDFEERPDSEIEKVLDMTLSKEAWYWEPQFLKKVPEDVRKKIDFE